MKPDIHPNYRPVVFHDLSSGEKILTKSTARTSETIEWEDGNTYPLYKSEILQAGYDPGDRFALEAQTLTEVMGMHRLLGADDQDQSHDLVFV